MPETPTLDVKKAARRLHVCHQTVRRMVHRKELTAYKKPASNAMWFRPSDIDRLAITYTEHRARRKTT